MAREGDQDEVARRGLPRVTALSLLARLGYGKGLCRLLAWGSQCRFNVKERVRYPRSLYPMHLARVLKLPT